MPEYNRVYLTGDLEGVYLTQRESQCLSRILEGDTLKDAAKYLDISINTVQGHLRLVKLKMRCNRRGELIKTAKKCGFKLD